MKPLNSDEIKLCQLQGKLFEYSVDKTNYSSSMFIRRFMYSNIVDSFDDKTFIILSQSFDNILEELDKQYGSTIYGSKKYTKDQMYWIGYIYRCFAIIYKLSSKQVYRLIGANEIVKYYNVYHTFDIVEATNRIADNIGYKEENYKEKSYKYMKKLIIRDKLIELLGKEVTVYIDRPIGSKHQDYPNLEYKVNYGYIKDIKAVDNEYQDAYVLGVNKPLKTFKGVVKAIITRKTDEEDKLIVCDIKDNYTNKQIRDMIDFQEKYYKYRIINSKLS